VPRVSPRWPKPTCPAAGLAVSTVCSRFPEVWLYSRAEEPCSESVLPSLVLSITWGEGTCAGGCHTAEEGHKRHPVESPAGGCGLESLLVQKPHTWSLVGPSTETRPPLGLHSGTGEEGEGREPGEMWQPLQGDVARRGLFSNAVLV